MTIFLVGDGDVTGGIVHSISRMNVSSFTTAAIINLLNNGEYLREGMAKCSCFHNMYLISHLKDPTTLFQGAAKLRHHDLLASPS